MPINLHTSTKLSYNNNVKNYTSQKETLNCLLFLLLGAYRLSKALNFIRFPATRSSQRAVAFNRSLIQIWHAPGKTNRERYTKGQLRESCQHVTLGSLQENILRQSGFEKDLEEIRTHLDCCRGGKLRILLVFLLVIFDIMLTFFICFICFRNVALSKLMIIIIIMSMTIMLMIMILIMIMVIIMINAILLSRQ